MNALNDDCRRRLAPGAEWRLEGAPILSIYRHVPRALGSARASEVEMIRNYLERALARARYTELEDGGYCAVVRGLPGVIATGGTLEACRDQLQEVVEEWVLVRVSRGLNVPALGGVRIRIRRAG